MIVHILAILVLGLMCGSELSIAAFGHPALKRQPLSVRIPVRASLAATLGRVMPFWMSGSALLNLLLLFNHHLGNLPWRVAAISFAIQALAIVFSLVAPVPINNRIMRWTPGTLPADWEAQEQRWDQYHWLRTIGLIAAFALLVWSLR